MAVKASDRVKYYENPNGPVIGTVNRNVIEKDGLYFKDLDGSGEWKIYDDWRMDLILTMQLDSGMFMEQKILCRNIIFLHFGLQ